MSRRDFRDLQLREEEVKHGALGCLLAVQFSRHVDFDLGQLAFLHRGGNLLGCSLGLFGNRLEEGAGNSHKGRSESSYHCFTQCLTNNILQFRDVPGNKTSFTTSTDSLQQQGKSKQP